MRYLNEILPSITVGIKDRVVALLKKGRGKGKEEVTVKFSPLAV